MCGRLSVAIPQTDLGRAFPEVDHLDTLDALDLPRYNVGPTQHVPAIVAGDDGSRWSALGWWLTPRWAKEQTNRYATFNARAENVTGKPAFRASFRDRRCLVVGTSFFEWHRRGLRRRTRVRCGPAQARLSRSGRSSPSTSKRVEVSGRIYIVSV